MKYVTIFVVGVALVLSQPSWGKPSNKSDKSELFDNISILSECTGMLGCHPDSSMRINIQGEVRLDKKYVGQSGLLSDIQEYALPSERLQFLQAVLNLVRDTKKLHYLQKDQQCYPMSGSVHTIKISNRSTDTQTFSLNQSCALKHPKNNHYANRMWLYDTIMLIINQDALKKSHQSRCVNAPRIPHVRGVVEGPSPQVCQPAPQPAIVLPPLVQKAKLENIQVRYQSLEPTHQRNYILRLDKYGNVRYSASKSSQSHPADTLYNFWKDQPQKRVLSKQNLALFKQLYALWLTQQTNTSEGCRSNDVNLVVTASHKNSPTVETVTMINGCEYDWLRQTVELFAIAPRN